MNFADATNRVMSDMKMKNRKKDIEIYFESDKKKGGYKIFTDELKYGDHLEVVFSDTKQCYVVKGLIALKRKWYKQHN